MTFGGPGGDQNSTEGHKMLRSCFLRGGASQVGKLARPKKFFFCTLERSDQCEFFRGLVEKEIEHARPETIT